MPEEIKEKLRLALGIFDSRSWDCRNQSGAGQSGEKKFIKQFSGQLPAGEWS